MPLRLLIAMACLLFSTASSARSVHEVWKFKLTGEDGIQRFNRIGGTIWQAQQGVVFLSPDRLLIYQVNRRREPVALSPRTPSGGSGNFVLVVRVLDVKTGVEIKHMQFLTTAYLSSVAPTHDGKFIVRAGDMLVLYDPDFRPLAGRKMLQGTDATLDYWEISVTPSGKQVALVHQRRFGDLRPDPKALTRSKSEADVEILNADTFEVIKTFHLPGYLPIFSAHDQFLLTTTPQKPLTDTEFGAMDFTGKWAALHPTWAESGHRCVYNMDLLEHDLLAARGCGQLVVFSVSGQKVLALPDPPGEHFESVAGGARYLALRADEYDMPPFGVASLEPAQIELYDLQSRERVGSVKLQKNAVYYALSEQGFLAVVDGDEVRLYQTD